MELAQAIIRWFYQLLVKKAGIFTLLVTCQTTSSGNVKDLHQLFGVGSVPPKLSTWTGSQTISSPRRAQRCIPMQGAEIWTVSMLNDEEWKWHGHQVFFSLRHRPPWVEIHQMPPFWSYILGASVEVAHWYEMARRDRMATWHWMALGCRFGLFFDLFWWRLYTYRNARNVCFFSHHWCRLFVGVSVYLFSVAFVQAKGIRTFVSCLQPQSVVELQMEQLIQSKDKVVSHFMFL